MAKVTLYVPDPLYRRMVDELPDDFNWSALFQVAMGEALARIEGCRHRAVRCVECRVELAPVELARRGGGGRGST